MKLLWGSIVFIVALGLAPHAQAQLTVWNNTGTNNSFDSSNNWSNGVPTAATAAFIEPGFLSSTNAGVLAIPGGATNIGIVASASHSAAALQLLGDFANLGAQWAGTVNLTFSPGTTFTLASTNSFYGITDAALISGGDTLNFSGNLTDVGGDIYVGDAVNFASVGTGSLTLSNGLFQFDGLTTGTNIMPYRLIIGDGATGNVTQSTGSTVYSGNITIGNNGGTGVYTTTNSAVLDIGTPGAPASAAYALEIGAGNNSTGTLNISGILNATNPGTVIELGTASTTNASLSSSPGTNASGTIVQSGGAVNIDGNMLLIGNAANATGTYELLGGGLNILNTTANSTVDLGVVANSTGNFVQMGGALSAGATSAFIIGDRGAGNFSISGGTADFQNGFILGNHAGAIGTFTQTGGAVTSEAAITIGGAGTGIYNLNGGSATFGLGVTVSPTGTLNLGGGSLILGASAVNLTVASGGVVNQTAGTLTIASNQLLDLSAAGSSYNLNGGILQVGTASLPGTTATAGTLNGGGGTLKISSNGAFTDPYNGTLAAGTVTTFDGSSTSNSVTAINIAGSLGGAGGVGFLGIATTSNTAFGFSSTTNNTYTGSTFIQNGTLTANLNQIGSSDLINLVNTYSVLDFATTIAGVNKLGAVLTGAGTLNVSFTNVGDTLELANPAANTFTGTINLGVNAHQGTLQIFNGAFGPITDNGTHSNVTIGEDATVTSSGTVTFAQNEAYTGLTTVGAGFTLNAQGLAGAATTDTNAILTANNIAGNVINNGSLGSNLPTLSAGVTPTFTIGGTLTSSGTLYFRTAGVNSDLYKINGAGTSSVTGPTPVTGFGSSKPGGNLVLDVTTGTLAPFTTVMFNNGLLFSGSITQSGNTLLLTTVQLGLVNFAQTPNQAAVANALDPDLVNGALPPSIGNAINNLTAAQIPVALDELSPELLQYPRTIAFENATFLAEKVDGALANVRAGYAGLDASGFSVVSAGFESGLGQSLSSLLAYDPPSFNRAAPNGVNYYPQPVGYTPSSSGSSSSSESSSESGPASGSGSISDTPNPDTTISPASMSPSEPNFNGPVMSEFILGNAVLADMNKDTSAPNAAPSKASYVAGSATAGISFRMTNNLAAGVLFDYNHTDAKTDTNGSKTDVDSFSPGVYGTWFDKGFYVNGLFSFGYNNYSNSRAIPLLGATANSTTSGEQYVGNLDFGYDFQPRHNREWIFGPTLGLTYTHLEVNNFGESNAGAADLAVASQDVNSLRSRLGGHVIYQARSGSLLFQPNVSVMWQHEYLDNPGITSQFSIPGTTPFTIQTATTGKDSALLGAGLTVTLDNSMAVYVNYLADVGQSNFLAQSIVGGFKASF